jgi:DNA helicase HerA-like ATPase
MAGTDELRLAYYSDHTQAATIGTLLQDESIPAMVLVDDLLGKHCAILGSTGTGKSCGVALILQQILKQNPNAHVLLLDPHNEYASCFGNHAEVITPADLQLPFWFLTFEEIIEVVIGDTHTASAEEEILAELVPLAKMRYAANRGRESTVVLKRGLGQTGRYTVDTPVPYRMSDLVGMIDERMGRLENKRDLAPYRQLKSQLESVSSDPRYAFMFGNLTVQDHMSEILGRLFRVPVQGKPIAILELTGVPSEIVNVVVSVICRMTFDFALWGNGKVPVTLVCEEAHRYMPNNPKLGFEPTRRAIARIAKEGRKYGVSLCVISQRPSELDPTILSQCNTVFAMRMSNDRDQAIVRSAIFDTASSLLDFLPSMGMREAIVFGDGVTLPGRIRFADLPANAMPRGRTASFTQNWQSANTEEGYLDDVVARWRAAGSPDAILSTMPDDMEGDEFAAMQGQPVPEEAAMPFSRQPLPPEQQLHPVTEAARQPIQPTVAPPPQMPQTSPPVQPAPLQPAGTPASGHSQQAHPTGQVPPPLPGNR